MHADGQVLDDIDMCNKVHEMLYIFSATHSKDNDYGEILFFEFLGDPIGRFRSAKRKKRYSIY